MESVEKRFRNKVEKTRECWLWMGCKSHGYGRFRVAGRTVFAHRWAFEQAYGVIPKGIDVLHLCDTPACVRHDHLYLGTDSENMLDAVAAGTHNETRKTHCPQGHPYDEENTRLYQGRRHCKRCNYPRVPRYARPGRPSRTVSSVRPNGE